MFRPGAAFRSTFRAASCLAVLAACTVQEKPATADSAATAATAATANTPTPPRADAPAPGSATADSAAVPSTERPPSERPRTAMRIEIDTKARQAKVFGADGQPRVIPVAVGSSEWPTRTGEWVISQVVFNPAWIPPDESWADEREPREPGDPKNPLGRAQLIYDPPRTIHGTSDPTSIGKAVSHGSIRMRNEDIVRSRAT